MRIHITDTSSCITDIAIKNTLDNDRSTIFIVPEPSKAQIERSVIRSIIENKSHASGDVKINGKTSVVAGFADGDVVSFIKLSGRILDSLGIPHSSESDTVLRNAIYSVLAKHHSEFNTFADLTGRCENINRLISLLGDFARYNITVEEISKAIDASGGSKDSYINKLSDIKMLMEYLNDLSDTYSLNLLCDPISLASDVLEKISPADLKQRKYRHLRTLLSHHFSIIQFGVTRNFTPGEYKFVNEIDRLSKGIDIYLNGRENVDGDVPFYRCSDQIISSLKSIPGASVEMMVDNTSSKSDDLSAVSEAYKNGSDDLGVKNSKDIRLYEIAATDDILGFSFSEIKKITHIKNGSIRYRDIKIVCCDEDMIGSLRNVASDFGLDVFVDRKITLNDTPVPRFVQLLLRLPISRFALGDVLAILRTGMLRIPPRYCDVFENYCVAKNITDAARMFNENNYITKDEEHPMTMMIEYPGNELDQTTTPAGEFLYRNVVERVLLPLREAALRIYNKSDMAGKAEETLNYLDEIKLYVEELGKALSDDEKSDVAKAVIRAYDETMSILAAFMHEMNKVDISQRNFLELFRTDMMNKTEGSIPLKVDSIEITSPEHAFYSPCKVMFIIGAKRDNFPYKRSTDGIMSPTELTRLAGDISVVLPDKKQVQSREEFITSCLILGACSDRLYMIHKQGESRSRVFDLLSGCVNANDILINNYKTESSEECQKRNFDIEKETISPDLMKVLLKDGLTVSVTTLERYMTCHIEFMLSSVLKIRERDDNREVGSNVFGTLAHKMFEVSLEECCKTYDTPEKLGEYADLLMRDNDALDKLTEDTIKKTLTEEKVPGSLEDDGSINKVFDSNQCNKLRRLFRFMFPAVVKDCSTTKYIPAGYELKIGEEPYLKVYEVNGAKFIFTGSVDRFDKKYDDANKFRIVDYKSYDKKFHAADLLAGTQIQLPTYAASVKNGIKDSIPGDFGYSLIALNFDKSGKPLSYKQENANLSPEDMNTALKYNDHIINEALNDIAAGKADALLNPMGEARFQKMMALVGNSASAPKKMKGIEKLNRKKEKEAFDRMRKILEDKEKKNEGDGSDV